MNWRHGTNELEANGNRSYGLVVQIERATTIKEKDPIPICPKKGL